MLTNVEHLGIAVKNIAASDELFSKLFNTSPYKHESVESEGVTTSFFKINQTKIELLEATNPESPIAKFIEKKGEGEIATLRLKWMILWLKWNGLKMKGLPCSMKFPNAVPTINWCAFCILRAPMVS